ncbi:MAG: enoyl-CoA hydratase/isomerase family protein [bacterium]
MVSKTITLSFEGPVARISLNRPEVHNAFSSEMFADLDTAFSEIAKNEDNRVVVLTGEGKSFCAGADLNWMKKVKEMTFEESVQDSLVLSELLYRMYSFPRPTIARVNGAAIGGGSGFVCVCDIAVASDRANFSFSEVKLGLVPACISPYAARRIGESRARRYFLTGERLSAKQARDSGLVNFVVKHEELDDFIDSLIERIVTSGPYALSACKRLIEGVTSMSLKEAKRFTAEVLAELRKGEEAQEGMAAFLEKRKPNWVAEK